MVISCCKTSMVVPLGGTAGGSDSVHHRVLKKTSMTGPLGALPAVPAASTVEFEDDVNGEPPGGHCQWVRLRPPLSLKILSMVGPLGGGRCRWVRQRPPLSFEDYVDGGPLGGTVGGSGGIH
jgi:hypothetical protein